MNDFLCIAKQNAMQDVSVAALKKSPFATQCNHSVCTKALDEIVPCKLGRYHDIIKYRDTNLETISISDRFGFNRNIDISRQMNRSLEHLSYAMTVSSTTFTESLKTDDVKFN